MGPIVLLLGGIALAAGVFAAFLWSLYQVLMTRGWLRRAHLVLGILTLAGMLALQLQAEDPARIAGVLMIVAAMTAIGLEPGWSRLLPALQFGFGAALAGGLPFDG